MAPRAVSEIFVYLNSDLNTFECNFLKNLEEICSHPKDIIIHNLNSMKENVIRSLRERLFFEVLDSFSSEQFREINVTLDSENPMDKIFVNGTKQPNV